MESNQNFHKAKSLKIFKYIITLGSKKANKTIIQFFKKVVYSCYRSLMLTNLHSVDKSIEHLPYAGHYWIHQ